MSAKPCSACGKPTVFSRDGVRLCYACAGIVAPASPPPPKHFPPESDATHFAIEARRNVSACGYSLSRVLWSDKPEDVTCRRCCYYIEQARAYKDVK